MEKVNYDGDDDYEQEKDKGEDDGEYEEVNYKREKNEG